MFVASIWGMFPELDIHPPPHHQWVVLWWKLNLGPWAVNSSSETNISTKYGTLWWKNQERSKQKTASKGRWRCSGEYNKDKFQGYKIHKVRKTTTLRPRLFHLSSTYWISPCASGIVLGPRDRDEQKKWPGPHEAYSFQKRKTLNKSAMIETHRALREKIAKGSILDWSVKKDFPKEDIFCSSEQWSRMRWSMQMCIQGESSSCIQAQGRTVSHIPGAATREMWLLSWWAGRRDMI